VERPVRTKHEWGRHQCVARFDHYCDFIANDVGIGCVHRPPHLPVARHSVTDCFGGCRRVQEPCILLGGAADDDCRTGAVDLLGPRAYVPCSRCGGRSRCACFLLTPACWVRVDVLWYAAAAPHVLVEAAALVVHGQPVAAAWALWARLVAGQLSWTMLVALWTAVNTLWLAGLLIGQVRHPSAPMHRQTERDRASERERETDRGEETDSVCMYACMYVCRTRPQA
jgi:hypothetical protein